MLVTVYNDLNPLDAFFYYGICLIPLAKQFP